MTPETALDDLEANRRMLPGECPESAGRHIHLHNDSHASVKTSRCKPNFALRRPLLSRWARRFVSLALCVAMKRLSRKKSERRGRVILYLLAKIAPGVVVVHLRLAEVALRIGDDDAARDTLRATILDRTGHPWWVYIRLARLHIELEDLETAFRYLILAKTLSPESPEIWRLLGDVYEKRGEVDESVRCFQRQLECSLTISTRIRAMKNEGRVLRNAGRKEAVVAISRRMLELDPHETTAYYAMVDCGYILDATDPIAETMRQLLAIPSLDPSRRQHLHYALGRLYNQSCNPPAAFAHYVLANQIRSRGPSRFDFKRMNTDIDFRCATFTAERIAALSGAGCQDDSLTFIVGMPRSGTTLVEQILSSHSVAWSLGERTDVWRITQNLQRLLVSRKNYPRCCELLTPHVVRKLAQSAHERLRRTAPHASRIVTIKNPEDFWELGLIRILFPKSRIIHCERHPIDTCLSCYMQDFFSIPYATSLEGLAIVYKGYRRMMRHWNRVLPPPATLSMSYENLVMDHEAQVRRLCDFCQIPFEENCLQFHHNPRSVTTASVWQVRRPIYTSSVGRWERYREYLGSLLELAEPDWPIE